MTHCIDIVKKFLDDNGFACSLEKGSREVPFDRLLVSLAQDSKQRDRILKIAVNDNIFDLSDAGFEKISKDSIARIEFFYELPFKVINRSIPDIASTLLFINRMLELPGFELNELDNVISYRYVLFSPSNGISKDLLLSIIGIIAMVNDLFANMIESIGNGESSFNDLLDQMIQAAERLK